MTPLAGSAYSNRMDAPPAAGYRPNVGIVLFSVAGHVWLGRRAGQPGPHSWQFPQGGVDEGEALEAAARRELEEETGVVSATLLARVPGWITYDFPPGFGGSKAVRGFKGQTQAWFAFRFDGEDSEIALDRHADIEFDAWRWAPLDAALDAVVPFKRKAYEAVLAHVRPLAERLQAHGA